MLLPEITKLANNLVKIPDSAINHAHGSTNTQQTPTSFPANPNLSHTLLLRHTNEKSYTGTIREIVKQKSLF